MTNSRKFNFKKKSKIKVAQNIFLIKAKINNKNVKKDKYKTKLIIYVIILSKIVESYNNYRQENIYNTTRR